MNGRKCIMEKMDLSKKVLASLLTMSCVYLGGTSALPMAEAAENDPNNTVGQVITVGGSLTGGDIFNFTSENTANSTGPFIMGCLELNK